MNTIRLLSALLVVALVAGPAAAEVSPEELEAAKAELLEVRAEAQALTDRFEEAVETKEHLDERVVSMQNRADELTGRLEHSRARLQDRAAHMYMDALGSNMAVLLTSSTIGDVGTSLEYLEDVTESDQRLVADLDALEDEYARSLEELEEAIAAQAVAVSELDAAAEELNAKLEGIQAEYNELFAQWQKEEAARIAAAEAERRRRLQEQQQSGGGGGTAPPTVTGGRTCPVNGFTSFSDTWGAPRSGGRSHRGVDMMAARGTQLVAIESGVISRMRNGGLGGITIWLRGNSGDAFYYAHLDGWAPGLSQGQSVSAGQYIGTVGTTGNAPANVPHLHFEYHPGGSGAVNPTPLVRALCG